MSILSRLWSRTPKTTALDDVLTTESTAAAPALLLASQPIRDVLREYNWPNRVADSVAPVALFADGEPAQPLAAQAVREGLQRINWANRRPTRSASGVKQSTSTPQAAINTVDDVVNQFAWD